MVDIKKVNGNELKESLAAMKEFLKDKPEVLETLKDSTKQEAYDTLVAVIDGMVKDGTITEAPEICIDFYNTYEADEGGDETEGGEEGEADAKAGKKSGKKDKPKKEKKPKKEVAKDDFGFRVGSGAAIMNEMMAKGATIEQMMESTGSPKSRISPHLHNLKNKGLYIANRDGVYTLTKEKPEDWEELQKTAAQKKEEAKAAKAEAKAAKEKEKADAKAAKEKEKAEKAAAKKKANAEKAAAAKTSKPAPKKKPAPGKKDAK